MSDSEDLLPRRLEFVCRNADSMSRKLLEKGSADWIAALREGSGELAPVLQRLEDDLGLQTHTAWTGGGIRGPAEMAPEPMGGFPRDPGRARVQPYFECPRPVGERCTRSVPLRSGEDGGRPRCALTGTEMRWSGRLGWSGDDDDAG
jgi:hypothetical protein